MAATSLFAVSTAAAVRLSTTKYRKYPTWIQYKENGGCSPRVLFLESNTPLLGLHGVGYCHHRRPRGRRRCHRPRRLHRRHCPALATTAVAASTDTAAALAAAAAVTAVATAALAAAALATAMFAVSTAAAVRLSTTKYRKYPTWIQYKEHGGCSPRVSFLESKWGIRETERKKQQQQQQSTPLGLEKRKKDGGCSPRILVNDPWSTGERAAALARRRQRRSSSEPALAGRHAPWPWACCSTTRSSGCAASRGSRHRLRRVLRSASRSPARGTAGAVL